MEIIKEIEHINCSNSSLTNFFSDNKKESYNLSDHWLKWGDGTKSKFYLDLSDTNDDRKRLKIDGQPEEQAQEKKAATDSAPS